MSVRYVMERRYKVGTDPGEGWLSKGTVGRARMLARVARFTTFHKVRTRRRGKDYPGEWISGREGNQRVRRSTLFQDEGYKVFIQRRRDRQELAIHKIQVEPEVPDLGCHPDIEKAYAALVRRFGTDGILNGGIYYCRDVDGRPGLRSRHGYIGPDWKGAAVDIFSSPDNMGALADRAYFLVAQTVQGELNLDRIIVGASVWESYDGRWHQYDGAYHRHVHAETHAGWPC